MQTMTPPTAGDRINLPGERSEARSGDALAVAHRGPGSSRTRTNRQRRRDKARARLFRTGSRLRGSGGTEAPAGPLSTVWGEQLTRGDLAQLRTAIRNDWPIEGPKRVAFTDLVFATLQSADGNDRLAIAVAETALAMNGANLRGREGGDA